MQKFVRRWRGGRRESLHELRDVRDVARLKISGKRGGREGERGTRTRRHQVLPSGDGRAPCEHPSRWRSGFQTTILIPSVWYALSWPYFLILYSKRNS